MNKKTYLILACILLSIALLPLPYGYYQILRLVIFILSVWILIDSNNKEISLPIGLFITAIIYNPIYIIHFEKSVWSLFNIITLIYFIYLISHNKHNA
ncbi:MAG TPA: hypothetical protein PKJ33_00660 [Alphaproteobacteria bacterium]|nr:hypothetical protein [Alphaproteobacteria bacterium]